MEKISNKILKGIGILGILCFVLISGCISEEKQGIICNPPYIQVGNDCCLDQNNNSICDKDEMLGKTETETPQEEPAEEEQNESEMDKIETIQGFKTEREEVESWCLGGREYARYSGGGQVAMTNDVKKYKDRWMCHNKNFLDDGGYIDIYWTKYEEEVYTVTTRADGTVEETKSGSGVNESKDEEDACKNIKDSTEKNNCYIKLAASSGDTSICDRLIMEEHDNCYKEVAISKENVLLCDRIENSDTKDDCYNAFAISEEDSSVCGKIQKQEKRDDCYNYLALSTEDPGACGKIDIISKRDDCYNGLALSKEDHSICSEIKIDGRRNDCYNTIALSTENPDICHKITSNTERDDCFKKIAISKENQSICVNIKSDSKRDDCYNEIALLKKDSSICNKIESRSKRDDCYESIEG